MKKKFTQFDVLTWTRILCGTPWYTSSLSLFDGSNVLSTYKHNK